MLNPYRDEAVDGLAHKSPAQIGLCGSTPMWGWIGNIYLLCTTTLQDRYPDAVLPVGFDLLTGHVTGGETARVYKGYTSRGVAVEALDGVRRQLE